MHTETSRIAPGPRTRETVLNRMPGTTVALVMTGLLIAGGTLLVGPRAAAQSHAERQNECSNRTLRGSYAFAINGTIIAGPNRLVLRALAMTEFDGSGNLTQVDFSTIDGVPTGTDWRPAVGSYEVDANCTGTMQIIPSVGPTLNLKLVVADHGRTVHNVVLGNATGAIGTKVD